MARVTGRYFIQSFASTWKAGADWLTAIGVALAIGVMGQAGLLRVPDGMVFDLITSHEPARKPRVIVVEQDAKFAARGDQRYDELVRRSLELGVRRIAFMADPGTDVLANARAARRIVIGAAPTRVPGRKAWRLFPASVGNSEVKVAARTMAAPEYGIFRKQLAWLKGSDGPVPALEVAAVQAELPMQAYYVRMPTAQNVPQVSATQLLNGDLGADELKGMIALISPPSRATSRRYATPLGYGGQPITASEFSAYAIQTLADRRAVFPLRIWQAPLLILLLCLAAVLLYKRFDPKRILIPVVTGITLAVLGGTVLALQFANIFMPVTALMLSQALMTGFAIYRTETWQDHYLSRQVDRAVNVAFKKGSFDNQARLPEILLGSAKVLGTRNMLLLEQDTKGQLAELGSLNSTLSDLSREQKLLNALFCEARETNRPLDASATLPSWEGPVWIAWLGGAERDIYWFYSLAGIAKRQRGERLAAAMISSYRQLQRLRASLSAGAGRIGNTQSIDERVTSALDLITGHDEQIRNGIDALDTAVMVFHLLGYPLHANARMAQLFEEADLALADVTLAETLAQLTELDPDRIAKMLHELLFHGGELRVPCRPLAARAVVLRIAAPFRVALGNERVIVLEAIDITNLKRLADLRLSVSHFIDTQLRNDLMAIGLGATVASDKRLEGPALKRVIDLIAKAAKRATERLESVASLINDPTDGILGLAYPIDASNVARLAIAKVGSLADDLQVSIAATVPASGGYTIAEPESLEAMLEAILRIMIAETQPGNTVQLDLVEEREFTRIRLSGGFGVSFDSLCAALDSPEAGALPEYRAISRGIKQALGWKSNVSYWSDIGKGYRFNIELRRIT
jgi:CHASE2 domain